MTDVQQAVPVAQEAFLDQLRRVNSERYEAWITNPIMLCEHCGADASVRSPVCKPPFDELPHSFTRPHPYLTIRNDAGIMFDALELGGEVGELLNVVKKLEREERGWRGSRAAPEDFPDECADVLICLDKLARRRNVDLAAVTISKFNATSEKVGLPHRLEASLGSGAPAEQEIAVSVAERVEPRPVGDPEIIQVEDRAGSQREAEGVPRDHARENAELREALEGVIEHATNRIQDGTEMGATIWRIALEDLVRDARAALSTWGVA